MQNAAFATAGLDWEYALRDVLPEELEAAVQEVEYANVTAPYKLDVARILDSELPSVNTVVRGRGFSTDAAILEQVTVCYKPAIVGDGGAAAAFRHALPEARVFSRHGEWPPDVGDCDLVIHATPLRDEVLFELGPGSRGRRRRACPRRPRGARRSGCRELRALDEPAGTGGRDAARRRLDLIPCGA
jgi:hypothetical protein